MNNCWRQWEPDVELIAFERLAELAGAPVTDAAPAPVVAPQYEIDLDGLRQDCHVRYIATKERSVDIMVTGFGAKFPLVIATTLWDGGGRKATHSGELIGCRQGVDGEFVPSVLRTSYQPVLREVAEKVSEILLPTALRRLRAY